VSITNNAILYPNVTAIPGKGSEAGKTQAPKTQPGEFDQILDSKLQTTEGVKGKDLYQIQSPLKFSAHALQRLSERKIALDPETLTKLSGAIDKAESKGVDDTLVLTKDAALIVNVKNRTVVTAMDKNQLTGNVFTNIDGAVII
jgi:flagellar operon protein